MRMLPSPALLALVMATAAACGSARTDGATAAQTVGVSVSPLSASVVAGGVITFTAAAYGASDASVSWSVREGVTGGRITGAGVYTAPATPGTYHVVAASVAEPSATAASPVSVTSAPPPTVEITVTVQPSAVSVAAGATVTFRARVANAATEAVTWTVREGSTGGSVTTGGLYTAPAGTGTYHVVATSQADATKSATATITVAAAASPPGAPTRLVASGASSSSTYLSWTDNSSNESGFYVERAPDSGGSAGTFAQVGSVAAGVAAYTDTGRAASTTYWYRVRAYNASGTSAYSNSASATTLSSGSSGGIRHVSMTGTNSGDCKASPCRTITYGVSQLAAGDTLIVGNGTYAEQNPIRNVPSGNAGPDGVAGTADDVYTTVQAETDFGVVIDGSGWPDTWVYGIRLENLSFVKVQGVVVHGRQTNQTGGPMTVLGSNHIKIIRCGFAYGPIDGNAANIDLGPDNDYVLVEECYSFGGSRYQLNNYWSDHTVLRRNVVRNDYWVGSLQSAGFTNYDSVHTVWENNIAVDSDESCCSGHLYAGFFNENKTDHAPDTSEVFLGNIVLNYKAFYGAHLDWVVSGTRVLADNIYWDSRGGYWGDQGPGVTASWTAQNLTSGAHTGSYDGSNQQPAAGTGMSILTNLQNRITSSLFVSNHSYGIADYVSGDYNAFSGNGTSYGGNHTPTPGAHDVTSVAVLPGVLKYLPRGPEAGSALATAGQGGGRVGAQVLWKIGVDGTLWGDAGYDTVRDAAHGFGGAADRLWPFPNEAAIKADMAAYSGGGLAGQRGFCTSGKQLDGTSPVTLTSYIWEYLGNPMPASLY